MKRLKVATVLFGAALMTGLGATAAFAKCNGEPVAKCSGEKKAKMGTKCSGEKKAEMNAKCGNSTMPAAPMKGKCGKGKCGS